MIRLPRSKSLDQFGLCQAFTVGRELRDHLCRDFVGRRRFRVLSALSAKRGTAYRIARSAARFAAARAPRMMRPHGFQRLRQFRLRKLAILVRVEFFHQVRRHLFGTWTLVVYAGTSLATAAGSAVRSTGKPLCMCGQACG